MILLRAADHGLLEDPRDLILVQQGVEYDSPALHCKLVCIIQILIKSYNIHYICVNVFNEPSQLASQIYTSGIFCSASMQHHSQLYVAIIYPMLPQITSPSNNSPP